MNQNPLMSFIMKLEEIMMEKKENEKWIKWGLYINFIKSW